MKTINEGAKAKTIRPSWLNYRDTVMLVVAIVATGLLAMGLTVYNYNKKEQAKITTEAALFQELDTDAQRYISAINAKFPGEQTHEKYCSYTSEIYSKGALSCHIATQLDVVVDGVEQAGRVQNYAISQLKKLNWGEPSLPQDGQNSPSTYSFSQGYIQKCSVRFYTQDSQISIIPSCTGLSLAEHYPVKESP